MDRPDWFAGVGDFHATISRRGWRALGLPHFVGRTVAAKDVSPLGVAGQVYDALTGEYYGGCISVVLHGEHKRIHSSRSRRCRQVQRRLRRARRKLRARRGW